MNEMADLALPKGWTCTASAGWTLVHYAATGEEPPTPPQVRFNGRLHPAQFSLLVAVDDPPTRSEDAVRGLVGLMFRIEEDSDEIRLAAVMSLSTEADVMLKKLTSHAPIPWWKRRALVQFALDDYRRWEASNPDAKNEFELERMIAADQAAWAASVPTTRRRNRISDARLDEVARIYREAEAAGESPTWAVATTTHTSHSHAAYLVSQARKKGKLPPWRSQNRKEP